jgi:DNA-binding transcriptional MocR family regulator
MKPDNTPWQPQFADRMQGMQASEIRELLKLVEQPGIISFAGGIPDPALFPRDEIAAAYASITGDPAQAGRALQYSVSEGDPGLRAWIAAHMTAKGVPCDPGNILITSGSQQALEFIGKLFLSPGDTALVTAPTYLGALQAFAANQPVYDTLGFHHSNRSAQSYIAAAAANGGRPGFAYVVPDFANPTGETLDIAQRTALLDLARQVDCPVIEDSPYSALRFEGDPMRSLQALDIDRCGSINNSRVLSCGSFSKVFTPGLRVGWVCGRRDIITRLTLIKQAGDLNSPAINQMVMLHLAQTLYDRQVEKTVAAYRIKRDAMLTALEKHMPDTVSWTRPRGGMFIWMTLPPEQDTAALLERAVAETGVAFVPGHAFFADKSGRNTLRLNYSLPSIEQIETGIAKLAGLLRDQGAGQ